MRSILRPFYFLLLVHVSSFAQGESVDWIRQRGTSTSDRSYGISADALGDVFVSFETLGSLGGPNAGALDVALSKYDSSGNAVWTRQFGTPQQDESRGLSADRLGNVYISGDTTGNLAGTNAGQTDVFVRKYDNNLSTRQK